MKSIIFTFDYELFLGSRPISSGTVDNCLINPTNKILDIFDQYNIKHAIFFVDTLYLFKMYENQERYEAIRQDLNRIIKQIKQIIVKGHYVMLHLHPHWMDAKYINEFNQWDLSNQKRYRFEALSESEKDAVFDKSFFILREILECKNGNFDAFRAGGYSIQPFSDFQPCFDKYNIKNDFSVLVNEKFSSEYARYNFTAIKNQESYRFQRNVLISEKNGRYREFPITKYRHSLVAYIKSRINNKADSFKNLNNEMIGLKGTYPLNGVTISAPHTKICEGKKVKLIYKIRKYIKLLFGFDGDIMSLENLNYKNYYYYLNSLKRKKYAHFISHPKGLSIQNIKTFGLLLGDIGAKFKKVNFDYKAIN